MLRAAEVAEICGVQRNTVYRWIKRGVFRRVKLGGGTFIRADELREHLSGVEPRGSSARGTENSLDEEARRLFEKFNRPR